MVDAALFCVMILQVKEEKFYHLANEYETKFLPLQHLLREDKESININISKRWLLGERYSNKCVFIAELSRETKVLLFLFVPVSFKKVSRLKL